MTRRTDDRSALALPSLAVFGVFFVLPMLYLVVMSFWRLRLYRLEPAFIIKNYALTIADYGESILFTIALAFVVGSLTTLLAYGFAFALRFRSGRWGDAYLFITLVTLFGGYLVKIYAWKTILGNGGILNTGLMTLGLIDEPITWFLFSPVAVVITLIHFLLPFAVLPIYGALRNVDPRHLEAARDLGARPRRVFRDIVLPQTQAGLVAAFTLAFLYSAGDYVTPRLVGGPNIQMVGTFIESQFVQRLNMPQGAAMAITTMAACVLFLLLMVAALRATLRQR